LNGETTGGAAQFLRYRLGVLLICNCVGRDETYPKMVDAEGAVLGEGLLDGILNGRGEFLKRNSRWGHWITSQIVKIGGLEGPKKITWTR
jgi:hypothetical protein